MKRRKAEARQPESMATNGAAAPQNKDGERPLEAPNINELGFWDQLHWLNDSQWQYHVVYLYRTEPPIRNGNDKNFIAKFTKPFDEADILATHGSGKYLAILNNTRERRTIGKVSFSCYHPEAPPKIRLAQLAPNADESWRTWLEAVEAKMNAPGILTTGAVTHEGESQIAIEAIRSVDAINQRLLDEKDKAGKEMALAKPAPAIDASVVTLITETAKGRDQLAERLSTCSQAGGNNDHILKFVLDELKETRASHAEEMKEMRKQHSDLMNQLITQKSEQANPLGQLDLITNVFGKVSNLVGKAGPRDWHDVIADTASEVAPRLVDLGQAYIQQRAIAERMRPASPVANRASPQSATATPAGTTPAVPAQPEGAQLANAPADANPTQAVPMDIVESTTLINIAMLASQALNLAMKGDAFAEQVVEKFGGQAYGDFVDHFDKTTLIEKLKSVPEAWRFLAEHQTRLPRFIDDFYFYAEGEPDNEPPTPTASPSAKTKSVVKGKKKN